MNHFQPHFVWDNKENCWRILNLPEVFMVEGMKMRRALLAGLGHTTPIGHTVKILKRENGIVTLEAVK